jgi:hypothetical protein
MSNRHKVRNWGVNRRFSARLARIDRRFGYKDIVRRPGGGRPRARGRGHAC